MTGVQAGHNDPKPEHGKDDKKGHHPGGKEVTPGKSHPATICYKKPFVK